MGRVLPVLFNTNMVRSILNDLKSVTRRLGSWKIEKLDIGSNGVVTATVFKETKRGKQISHFAGGTMNEFIKTYSDYQPGDILYVRETWSEHYTAESDGRLVYCYKADGIDLKSECLPGESNRWYPSIHMPKEAARIWLKVKDVRVEWLQEITEDQAKAEGICRLFDDMSKEEYEEWARKIGRTETQEECLFMNYLWHGNFGKYGSGNKLSDVWKCQYSGYANAVDSFSSLWNTTVDLKDWNRYGWDANPWVWVFEFERCEKPENK